MGKKRKNRKIRNLQDDDIPGIKFDLEDDADELFLSSLDDIPLQNVLKDKEEGIAQGKKEPKKKNTRQAEYFQELDLHGLRLSEAIYTVDTHISENLLQGPRIFHFKIITGRGIHSGPEGAVLPREVYDHIKTKFKNNILRIDESPAEVTIDSLPLKGYFKVTFVRKN